MNGWANFSITDGLSVRMWRSRVQCPRHEIGSSLKEVNGIYEFCSHFPLNRTEKWHVSLSILGILLEWRAKMLSSYMYISCLQQRYMPNRRALMKNTVLRNVTPCSLDFTLLVAPTGSLGPPSAFIRTKFSTRNSFCFPLACLLLILLFYPEDGGSTFLRNYVKLVPHNTASRYSS
jgi:hypothetical protein